MSKRRKKGKSKKGLAGVETKKSVKDEVVRSLITSSLVLLAGFGAAGAGAAVGRYSGWAGLFGIGWGAYKKNPYWMAGGLGLFLSNGYQNILKAQTTTQGVDGFDLKQIATDAKERVGTFLKNFSEKFYLPSSTAPANTTEGLGEDDVTYFVNPYSRKELDMSALDRIQEQIAEMNKPVSGTMEDAEFEREF